MSTFFNVCRNCVYLIFIWSVAAGCSSAPQKAKVYTVEIKDMKFVPEDIIVNKGDTITWINRDMVAHDVTEEASKRWTSGPIAAGGTWKMAVSDEANYYCSIHAVMKGKIELE
ncbi:plastocyanin/azurin family copper-binding protein [Mucilaginibacter ginsenosidivorans]|uniref:Plastocyanin n=1 Tax=Mucilaginibacter ginsenosidivorans TaxID=398053 RepID=A0A5B8UVC8_9SPHI|nr:plastocyanin/azurin family copper-binding protein [Mucilaginibacter ginsenosidivorans]QEC62301.1 plastocyanin [Mucilaginibacter ginsenosidivorans]